MRAWMQRFLLALTLLWVPALAEAEPVAPVHPVLASGDMRTNLDLSGLWHYSIDPYRDGMADRKSVVEGKSVSVRVDLGGRRNIKKKIDKQINITKYYTKKKKTKD